MKTFLILLTMLIVASAANAQFDDPVFYPVGDGANYLVEADLDGDGDLDIAVSNRWAYTISVLLNNGDGTFAPEVPYSTGAEPNSVQAADLDGDGDYDLVNANFESHNMSVLMNNGDGTFGAPVHYPAQHESNGIAVSDLDNDSDLDVAVANAWAGTVTVYMNNGDGTFVLSNHYTVAEQTHGWPHRIRSADLDGNGYQDLTVLNNTAGDLSILFNNGDGTFATAVKYTLGSYPSDIEIYDLDHDSDQDMIITVGGDAKVTRLTNNGDGTFVVTDEYFLPGGSYPTDLVGMHLDDDGELDLAVTTQTPGLVYLLLNAGGSWVEQDTITVGSSPGCIVSADLSGNGLPDLACSHYVSNEVAVILAPGASEYLVIPSTAAAPCDDECVVQPVAVELSQPIKGASVPIAIPEGFEVCSLSTFGLYTETWDIFAPTINTDSGYLLVGLANTQGYTIPEGVTTIFDIYFTATRECQVSGYTHWDTALAADELRQLKFSNANNQVIHPEFDVLLDSSEIVGFIPGDFNSSGAVDVSDLTATVDYLFAGGPAPCYRDAMDCNGDGVGPDIADLTYLVDYLFGGGAAPQCFGSKGPSAKISTAVSTWSSYDGQKTTVYISNDLDLRGLEIVLSRSEFAVPTNLIKQFNMFHYSDDSGTKLGFLDMSGIQTLIAGEHAVVSLEGEHQIVFVIASDLYHTRLVATLDVSAKQELLPDRFSLQQNYPNPFNPSTTIDFDLPQSAEVKLEIYNIMGQQVAVLVNSMVEAGTHSVEWNASDMASGVYLYRITAGQFVQTRKMMMLK